MSCPTTNTIPLNQESSLLTSNMAFANGYTMALKYNLDHLGILYLTIAGLWTVILLIGVSLLVKNRHLPYIRIRNVPLVVSAVCTLHVYWVLCFAAYVMNGFFPCATEFWIMSIYLPLGIALYHASNTQLLYIASLQTKYTAIDGPMNEKDNSNNVRGWRRLLHQFQSLNSYKKTMMCITVAMLVQVRPSYYSPILAHVKNSSSSPSLSSSQQDSSILALVPMVMMSALELVERAGNGKSGPRLLNLLLTSMGFLQSPGSSSGLGSTLLTSFGRSGPSTM